MALIGRRLPPVHSPIALPALASGWAAAIGSTDERDLERLEAALRVRFAADAVALTDSGTSALALAITAVLNARPGAPIALPAYSCYDLATAAIAANATVVLYDVDPTSLGPDWSSLDRALQAGAAAVVVAHLYGVPVDIARVGAACAATGAVIIEDAAQGIGGRWHGAPLGSHGPLSILSFGRGKGVTGGGGGALLGRGSATSWVQNAAATLGAASGPARPLAALTAQWLFARPSLFAIPASLPFLRLGDTVYKEPHPPRALHPALARIVIQALAAAETDAEVRRAHARAYETAAAERGGVVQAPNRGQAGNLRFPVLVDPTEPDASVLGVMPGYPRVLSQLPQLASRCANPNEPFPGAALLVARLRTAPTHSRLSGTDVQRVCHWLTALGELR